MSKVLDALGPEPLEWIQADLLVSGKTGERASPQKGREGLSAEQALRALIVKQRKDLSYEELAFTLSDSLACRTFSRLQSNQFPTKGTLQRNIKKISAGTLERINSILGGLAVERGIDDGEMLRGDSTVTETNIHEPSDSTLLWDCVRVLDRLMHDGRQYASYTFQDHSRIAKRRMIAIQYAKTNEEREPLYRDLYNVAERTLEYVQRAMDALKKSVSIAAIGIEASLARFHALAQRVLVQTRRRVFDKEPMPSSEKIVSIFEPHTDIIVKGRRDVEYGHKIFLTSGKSGFIFDCVVGDGNPADSSLAVAMIERVKKHLGFPPVQVAFDGGFASRANVEDIKALGVEDVAFSKKCGLEVEDMTSSAAVYKMLKRFRAGIESTISFIKRAFGLTRCLWSGLPSFKSYVWSSVVTTNLLVMARAVADGGI